MKPVFTFVFILLITTFAHTQTDDFTTIKNRVVAELMKTEIDDSRIESILSELNEDGSFKGINYEDLSRTAGFPHRRHTSNLMHLAKAYKSNSSKYFKKKKIKDAIELGLKHWVENDYCGDNWHNNQISTPTNLVNLMLVIGDEMPNDLVERAQPIIKRASIDPNYPRPSGFYGARPGGDRVVVAGIEAKNLLFTGDKEKFDEVIKVISEEIKFTTGDRGMQHDYSFHHRHDRVNNTTSYGYGKYANAFGEWMYYVANTKYAFSDEKINHLVDYYLDGIYKQLVYGIYTDISVKNRSITHKVTFEPREILEIERLLLSTDYRKDELEEILKLRKGEIKPSKSFAKFFWQTEHFVFQRPNYYTTVRMFSTRNRNMEVPYNGPGKPTHHRADGTNYLQLKGDEYHNIWPVYDWQKISGATIVQKPELYPPTEIQKDGFTDFVGAVTDGMFGAVAFDFLSPHDFVKAKKAWFFFDEEYLCLGAGINCNKNLPVATTINQVLMRSDVTISKNGQMEKLSTGNRELEGVKWVHQDRVGYVFPEPATVQLSNQTETGRWSDITDQKNISTELISKKVFSLWFDHGSWPRNASYQYIVLPDVSVDNVDEKSETNCNIEILSNTPDLQAAKHAKQEIVQLAFYKAGQVKIFPGNTVSMDSQGMAMLKMDGNRITEITVADPSRKLSRISVTVPGVYHVKTEDCFTVSDEENNSTLFMINLPQGVYAGKSLTIVL